MKSSVTKFCDNDKEETQAKRQKVSNDDSLINQYILDDNIRADISRSFRFVQSMAYCTISCSIASPGL